MTNRDPQPYDGGELGSVREGFPGVFYAENPTHILHRQAGRIHNSVFVNKALELGFNPNTGSLGYNRMFLTLRFLADEASEFRTTDDNGEPLPWEQSLNIVPSQALKMNQVLMAASALGRAYERHLSVLPTTAVNQQHNKVIKHVLEEEGILGDTPTLF